jgi:16S rRNA (guanine966-N2)-methyltransferase
VRIVAGAWGGRRLTAPAGDTTRPTSDRVREALFSALGPLEGAVVLDLFAGTGALGLEALSRGAARAVFVEQDRRALAALRANVAALGAPAAAVSVRAQDVRRAVRDAVDAADTYDLVLVDPPYRLAAGLGAELGPALAALLAPGGRVVTESDRRSPMDLTPVLPLTRERRYGDTLLRTHA